MPQTIVSCQCHDCHKELSLIQQQKWNGGTINLVTCWNPLCLLNSVTLTVEQYYSLSDAQFEDYRQINRARLAEKAVAS